MILFYDVDCNKKEDMDGDMVTYCPDRIEGQVYQKGIEHLLDFPASYRKEDYEQKVSEGDVTKFIPDKNKIKEYVFSLDEDAQKACLRNLYDTLMSLERKY